MKKTMDKLLNEIKFDKRYVFFCAILAILGIVTGSIFIIILNNADKELIIEYIETFIQSIINNNINYVELLKNTLINNYLPIMIITIFGLTYFLSFFNILILFYKSFVIGFSIASFILVYNLKGLLIGLIYIFPHLVINISLLVIFTAFTLKLSIKTINCVLKKKQTDMRHFLKKYICTFLAIFFLITITTLYESLILPRLLNLIIKII